MVYNEVDKSRMTAEVRIQRLADRLDARALAERDAESCDFCLKTRREVKYMVESATGARICDECVAQAAQLIARAELSNGAQLADSRRVLAIYSGNDVKHRLYLVSPGSPPGPWVVPAATEETAAEIREQAGADWAEWLPPEQELTALREMVWQAQLGTRR